MSRTAARCPGVRRLSSSREVFRGRLVPEVRDPVVAALRHRSLDHHAGHEHPDAVVAPAFRHRATDAARIAHGFSTSSCPAGRRCAASVPTAPSQGRRDPPARASARWSSRRPGPSSGTRWRGSAEGSRRPKCSRGTVSRETVSPPCKSSLPLQADSALLRRAPDSRDHTSDVRAWFRSLQATPTASARIAPRSVRPETGSGACDADWESARRAPRHGAGSPVR